MKVQLVQSVVFFCTLQLALHLQQCVGQSAVVYISWKCWKLPNSRITQHIAQGQKTRPMKEDATVCIDLIHQLPRQWPPYKEYRLERNRPQPNQQKQYSLSFLSTHLLLQAWLATPPHHQRDGNLVQETDVKDPSARSESPSMKKHRLKRKG